MSIPASTQNPPILVQSDGTIFYPYVGHLKVAGLTIGEVQTQISRKISVYIRDPQVTVEVARFRNRNVYVMGEVRAPEMQAITDKPLTLMEAINNSGGINSATADPTHIYLIRGSYKKPTIYWINAQTPQSLMIAEQFPLQENDIIYVSGATLNAWNTFINTTLPTFAEYSAIKTAAHQ